MPTVTLISHTPDPERAVAAAARLCYSADPAEEIMEGLSQAKTSTFLEKLVEMGHYSPLEHASFTFAISGVSRALSHQLVRHRIASYSQKSQRYVSEDQFEYVIPPSVAGNPETRDLFESRMKAIQEDYNRLIALGVPKEDARYLLPNACQTSLVCTMNARSLMNFFHLRTCTRAQWEIRQLAQEMLRQVKKVAAAIFANAGPACASEGICREGKMSCGKIHKMKPRALPFLTVRHPGGPDEGNSR